MSKSSRIFKSSDFLTLADPFLTESHDMIKPKQYCTLCLEVYIVQKSITLVGQKRDKLLHNNLIYYALEYMKVYSDG